MSDKWFTRKLYGYGWYPSSWQGWVVLVVYIVLMIFFGLTIDENSNIREIIFTFILPAIILTTTLIRIAIKKGEPARWQWGKRRED